ncbi:NodS family protein [Sphingomonas sp. Leaf34]|uniref:SAM-dependent methyltransferase n=1 Tax=Sphingomonas sp. Leaf34 TaxID=1736216 RepID=UPI0006F71C81|nr:SAM-dependent methyltransferase [Sphingomonas sp. Leaf34]KQN27331.1 NodS family protein [Sphingomonas sp. Leaf34]
MPVDHRAANASLDAGYFDGIFAHDDDPWSLASSAYEAAKFARTIAVLDDRRYASALEIGCAHGVLTRQLAPLCADLLAIDIAGKAIAYARERCRMLPQVRFERKAFPGALPVVGPLDLVMLSEVVYYWSDADLLTAGAWLRTHVAAGGRILLVHWVGATDYPQTGDAAVAKLHDAVGGAVAVEHAERTDCYRLDLWRRR